MRSALYIFPMTPWKSCERQRLCCSIQNYASNFSFSRRAFTFLVLTSTTATILPCAGAEDAAETPDVFSIRDILQRLFANDMENGMVQYERNMASKKQNLFSMIPNGATVTDIGIGTGPNLSYLPKTAHVIGVEPNEYMWPFAKRRALKLGIDIRLVNATGENIPLSDSSCDVVITTLTMCSVNDVQKCLSEIVRILKPDGLYIFIEHVLAPSSRPVLRLFQNLLTPAQRMLSDGCHLNRDIGRIIQTNLERNVREVRIEQFDAKIGGFEDSFSLIRPHVAGFARKKNL